MMAILPNPTISVTLPRGWWASVIEALQDAGPEYAMLASELHNAVCHPVPHEQKPWVAQQVWGQAVYAPVVMQDALVNALKQAEDRLDLLRSKTPQEHKGFYGSGMAALQELRNALLNPNRDGSGGQPADEGAPTAPDPAAQTTPEPSPVRPMEIAWPSELDPDDRAGIAQQLDAIGHSSGLTYWNDVAKALRSIRPPR